MVSPTQESTLANAGEAALAALAAAGDGQAFEELVRRRQGLIRGLLRQLSGDWALADDLAQEVFLLAWRRLSSLRSPGAFGGWLRRIAVNQFLQHVRRPGPALREAGEAGDQPAPPGRDAAAKMDLQQALKSLKPEERLCVVLSYSQGLSHGEICQETGLPLGTVKSHIARGRARLQQLLSDYEAKP